MLALHHKSQEFFHPTGVSLYVYPSTREHSSITFYPADCVRFQPFQSQQRTRFVISDLLRRDAVCRFRRLCASLSVCLSVCPSHALRQNDSTYRQPFLGLRYRLRFRFLIPKFPAKLLTDLANGSAYATGCLCMCVCRVCAYE